MDLTYVDHIYDLIEVESHITEAVSLLFEKKGKQSVIYLTSD